MTRCPKCGSELNIDEKLSGECFSCQRKITSTELRGYQAYEPHNETNSIGAAIKVCGIIILIIGTIGSFIIGSSTGDRFSLITFLLYESGTVVGGLILLGFSEIIQLLQSLNNKSR